MYRAITMTTMLSLLAAGACNKGEDRQRAPTAKVPEPTKAEAKAAADDPVGAVGVAAGGVQRDAADGPAAVVTATTGTVEVRRRRRDDVRRRCRPTPSSIRAMRSGPARLRPRRSRSPTRA